MNNYYYYWHFWLLFCIDINHSLWFFFVCLLMWRIWTNARSIQWDGVKSYFLFWSIEIDGDFGCRETMPNAKNAEQVQFQQDFFFNLMKNWIERVKFWRKTTEWAGIACICSIFFKCFFVRSYLHKFPLLKRNPIKFSLIVSVCVNAGMNLVFVCVCASVPSVRSLHDEVISFDDSSTNYTMMWACFCASSSHAPTHLPLFGQVELLFYRFETELQILFFYLNTFN